MNQSDKELEIRQLKLDYEDVFSTIKGQKVLQDILKSGGVMRSGFIADANMNYFECGKRTLAMHIKDMSEPRPERKKEIAVQ